MCPHCQSNRIVSNRYGDEQLERVDMIAKAAQPFGIRRLSLAAGVCAMLFKAYNAWLPAWLCLDCRHTFDDDSLSVPRAG